ncbi:MAG: tetratricopeptide repeat protein [Rhodobacteraceae bacterium]|nr:tetratricopeptide repeat protein [Paracoccaceae bacterium]
MGKRFAKSGLAIVALSLTLTACGEITDEDRQLNGTMNVIDASDMNDIMLNFADPNEAVIYFETALNNEPDRLDFKRGLAKSLMNARRHAEAVLVYEQIEAAGNANNEDRLDMADAYIRGGGWDEAQAQLNAIPPTYETYDRYRLEAIVADHNQQWEKADSFYDIARGLTTRPASVLNNWGFSKRIRGDNQGAAELFREALRSDPNLTTAKTNLVIVRALDGNYRLPVIPMNEPERAVLLFEIARIAIQRRDCDVAAGLMQEAIDTHPQHFEAAVAALEALNGSSCSQA